jgi:eukaryotic-like serine/threonine-protein kinase
VPRNGSERFDDVLRAVAASPPVALPHVGLRFEIRRRLGEGGMGVVYEALDKKREAVVALKTLTRLDPAGIYRLKAEFRSLADVQHPNLVRLHELFANGEQWFFTMDLVEGRPFVDHVRPDEATLTLFPDSGLGQTTPVSDGGRFQEGPLRDALRQLAVGVQAIHDEGKLHRDLKPSNVLVTPHGQVVILDFGLVSSQSDRPIGETLENVLSGTPAYMAPEQASGEQALPASDWYAVGTMLYQALTGRLPFTGSLRDVLAAKRTSDPMAPALCCDGIPEDLNALCVALLHRDAGRRATGADIMRVVGDGKPSPIVATHAERPNFVGRVEEHLQLESAWNTIRAGAPSVVLLNGPSGVGKTALAHRFLGERRRTSNTLILVGRCYEREFVPFKAFDGVVDALGRHLRTLPRERAAELLPRDIHALARVFPTLGRVEVIANATSRAAEHLDDHALRKRAFGALKDLFVKLCDRDDLVVFVDDLQWGDEDSAALLETLVGPPDPPPLLFLGCYRDDGEANNLVQRALALGGSRTSTDVRKVSVGPLSVKDAAELARKMFGNRNGADAAMRSEEIASESRGLPYFVGELVRFSETRPETASRQPASLSEILTARAAALPEAARHLLEVVALAGRVIGVDLAARVAQVAPHHDAIDALLAAKLLRHARSGDDVIAYHDRVRETIAGGLDRRRSREIYEHLALAVETTRKPEAEWLCELYQGAGLSAQAGAHAVVAGDQAAQGLAFARAAAHYRFALSVLQLDAPAESAIRRKLGGALASEGRGADAAGEYMKAAKLSERFAPVFAPERVELERAAAEQLLSAGRMEEAAETLHRVLAAVGMRAPRSPLAAVFWLVIYKIWLTVIGLRFKERDPNQVQPEDRLRVDALFTVSMGFGGVNFILAACMQARHLVEALRVGDRFQVLRATSLETCYAVTMAKRETKRERALTEISRRLAERDGSAEADAYFAGLWGIGLFQRGRWKDALAMLERAQRVTLHGNAAFSNIRMFATYACFYLGELQEGTVRLTRLCAEAEERGDLFTTTCMRGVVGFWLLADDPEGARRALTNAMSQWPRRKAFEVPHWQAMVYGADVDIYVGDGRSGYERFKLEMPALKRSFLLEAAFVRAYTHFVRGRLAIATIQACPDLRAKRIAEARRAVQRLERERDLWVGALASLVAAAADNADGNRAASIAALRLAIKRTEDSDTVVFAAPARYRLGELLGGSEGRALVEGALQTMTAQGIRNPPRWVALITPGRWE